MGFFSDFEPQVDVVREPQPQRVKWRGDPDDTVGVPVELEPLQVKNDQAAVIVFGLLVYPRGFAFSLATISRLSPAPAQLGFLHPGRGSGGELRFGIGFADGSKVVSRWNMVPGGETSNWTLRPMGGGGGGRKWTQGFWCEPLPPAGRMAFVCEWSDFAIPETSFDVDATAILDAAVRAAPLWPDDADLPEELGLTADHPGALWSSSTYGRMRP